MKHEYCPTCYQLLPKDKNDPLEQLACSEYHVICKICRWPTAKDFIEDEICRMCRIAMDKVREIGIKVQEEKKKLKVV